jgi:hypothetical protein
VNGCAEDAGWLVKREEKGRRRNDSDVLRSRGQWY